MNDEFILCGCWKSIDSFTISAPLINSEENQLHHIFSVIICTPLSYETCWTVGRCFPFAIKFNFEMNFDQREMVFSQALIFEMKSFYKSKKKKKMFVSEYVLWSYFLVELFYRNRRKVDECTTLRLWNFSYKKEHKIVWWSRLAVKTFFHLFLIFCCSESFIASCLILLKLELLDLQAKS